MSRRLVRERLDGHAPELVYNAELIVTELTTNALLHGGGRASVRLASTVAGLRIEVADQSPYAPLLALTSTEAMTGRGLALVASVASRWGVDRNNGGKIVWAELDFVDSVASRDLSPEELLEAWGDPLIEREPGLVHVSLGEVPTALLVAAKRHVDNLLREFVLATGGDESGTTSPLPRPLAELMERVVHNFSEARETIKRQATASARAGERRTTLELDLPLTAATAGADYLAALDEVDAYCRANRLLTVETPPQHRIFRQWYVGEIIQQLRAGRGGEKSAESVSFEERLLAEIDAAEEARRSAERSARLYTVAFAVASATSPEQVARAVVEEGVAALGAAGGGVLLLTESGALRVPATVGYAEPLVERLRDESPEADLPAAFALRTGEEVWLESVEARNQRFPALLRFEPETRALCAVPLAAGATVVGALRFSFTDPRVFDPDEQRFVLALAAEAADALQRALVLDREREMVRRLERERDSLLKVAAVGEAMARGRDLDDILQLATDAATQVVDAAFGAFFYNAVDDQGERYLVYSLSGAPLSAFEMFPPPRKTAVFGPTFEGEAVMRVDDITRDPRYAKNPPYRGMPDGHLDVRSYLAVPVRLATGEVAGGLFLGHPEPGRFLLEHEQLAVGIAGQAAAAIENVRRRTTPPT